MLPAPTYFESDLLADAQERALPDEVRPQPRQLRRPAARGAPGRTGVAVGISALRKSYGAREVLRGVDLQLQAGEFVAIVGRSGCGKSTLLRALAGLERPDSGDIGFGAAGNRAEDDSAGLRSAQLRIMFQEARLLPWKTVVENVALGLPHALNAAAAALSTVGLGERADDWPSALSGGQKQRVALARALVHQPQVLLLDEPLGALDALTRIEMQQLIESLWLARGFTAVLVTHDVSEAVALADRVLLIEDGAIALDLAIDLPRPRAAVRTAGHDGGAAAAFAAFEQRILSHVLRAQA
ncbi:aliphatic sulfonate ABC transporter ATP-binding protein [Massilia sp. Root351]|uniref:ATP-binding cassette domain-containing protein n=1 Tax=Massilia sp. Root351 TaxID=1736522 RepID=UPI00070BE06E|nr:ATP-binding cassette domain-containing protein [Massilia sp. Root351]KQV86267.1 aliphatic sulfonate ABC transporter ATP-binding protein [Massilia sp. Root351]